MMGDRGQAQPFRANSGARARTIAALGIPVGDPLVGHVARGSASWSRSLAALAYARALGNELTYDEDLVLARAAPFLQSWDFGALVSKRYFASSLEGTWRPFCTLTYMVDAALSMQPLTFKVDDLLWHMAAACLVMALARRLLPEGWRRYAIVAGLIFAVHPVTTETVDNASFREDALVTVLTLATLVLALGRRPWWSLGTFGLGLLSKESAVVGPRASCACCAWARLGDPLAPRPTLRSLLRELAPYGVVTVLYLAIRFGPLGTPMAYAKYPGGSFAAALAGLPAIWTHDLRLLVVPWPLCADLTGAFRFGRQPPLELAGALAVVGGYVAAVVVAARAGRARSGLRAGVVPGGALTGVEPAADAHPGGRTVPLPAARRDRHCRRGGCRAGGGANGTAGPAGRRWLLGAGGAGGVGGPHEPSPRRLEG